MPVHQYGGSTDVTIGAFFAQMPESASVATSSDRMVLFIMVFQLQLLSGGFVYYILNDKCSEVESENSGDVRYRSIGAAGGHIVGVVVNMVSDKFRRIDAFEFTAWECSVFLEHAS